MLQWKCFSKENQLLCEYYVSETEVSKIEAAQVYIAWGVQKTVKDYALKKKSCTKQAWEPFLKPSTEIYIIYAFGSIYNSSNFHDDTAIT